MSMEKAEGRKLLKEIQALVFNQADEDADKVLESLANFIESKKTRRSERTSRDRQERSGRDRGGA